MPSISASDVAIGMMPGLIDLGRTISNAWVEKQQVGERRRQFDTGQRENVRQFDEGMTFNRRKTALGEATVGGVGSRPSRSGGGSGGTSGGSLRDPFAPAGGDIPSTKPWVEGGEVMPGPGLQMTQAERLVAAQQARHANLADALENAGMTEAAMEQRKYAMSADTSDLTKWVAESSSMFQRGRSLLDSGGSVVGGRPSSASRSADPISTLTLADQYDQFLRYGTAPSQGADPRVAQPVSAQEPVAAPLPPPPPMLEPAAKPTGRPPESGERLGGRAPPNTPAKQAANARARAAEQPVGPSPRLSSIPQTKIADAALQTTASGIAGMITEGKVQEARSALAAWSRVNNVSPDSPEYLRLYALVKQLRAQGQK